MDLLQMISDKKMLLLDGSNVMFRAFFSTPVERFTTQDGQAINCVQGFGSILKNLLNIRDPSHIAVAFDLGRAGHRKDALPQYKEGRSETPPELSSQWPIVKEMLDCLGIRYIEIPRIEADDIIATLAKTGEENNMTVEICSSDKDMNQLVTEKVNILKPGLGTYEVISPEKIMEKYGFSPKQYRFFAALVGEGADNIPGVPGVGPAYATKWIKEYGDLDTIIAHADIIGGKRGESLKEHTDRVLLNYEINRLLTDVDLGIDLVDIERRSPNYDKTSNFFDELRLGSLSRGFLKQ